MLNDVEKLIDYIIKSYVIVSERVGKGIYQDVNFFYVLVYTNQKVKV